MIMHVAYSVSEPEEQNIWGSVQKGQTCPKDGSTLFKREIQTAVALECPVCGFWKGDGW
jgi:hypothetical protein